MLHTSTIYMCAHSGIAAAMCAIIQGSDHKYQSARLFTQRILFATRCERLFQLFWRCCRCCCVCVVDAINVDAKHRIFDYKLSVTQNKLYRLRYHLLAEPKATHKYADADDALLRKRLLTSFSDRIPLNRKRQRAASRKTNRKLFQQQINAKL